MTTTNPTQFLKRHLLSTGPGTTADVKDAQDINHSYSMDSLMIRQVVSSIFTDGETGTQNSEMTWVVLCRQ